jgi:hypothetical protein
MSPFFLCHTSSYFIILRQQNFFITQHASWNIHHTSSYIIMHHHQKKSCIIHHHTSSCIIIHHTSSCIIHHHTSSCIIHHHTTCIIHHTSYNIMHHTSYNMQNIQHTPCQSIPITTKSITCKAEILKHDCWHIRNFFDMSKSNHD